MINSSIKPFLGKDNLNRLKLRFIAINFVFYERHPQSYPQFLFQNSLTKPFILMATKNIVTDKNNGQLNYYPLRGRRNELCG